MKTVNKWFNHLKYVFIVELTITDKHLKGYTATTNPNPYKYYYDCDVTAIAI